MTQPNLALCPFCGGPAAESYGSTANIAVVSCINDGCRFQPSVGYADPQLAIKAWNTRASRPAADREAILEEAAQVCDAMQEVYRSSKYSANQPMSSFVERFVCGGIAERIRELKDKTASPPAPSAIEALEAVDALWTCDEMQFAFEMALGSPVGKAWSKVKAALTAAREVKA